MNKKKHRAITLLSVLTVMIAFFIAPIMSLAATVNYTKVADYVSTWHIKSSNEISSFDSQDVY